MKRKQFIIKQLKEWKMEHEKDTKLDLSDFKAEMKSWLENVEGHYQATNSKTTCMQEQVTNFIQFLVYSIG